MSVPMTPSSSCVGFILVMCSAVILCEHSLQPAPHHLGPINKIGLLLCNLCYHDVAPHPHAGREAGVSDSGWAGARGADAIRSDHLGDPAQGRSPAI